MRFTRYKGQRGKRWCDVVGTIKYNMHTHAIVSNTTTWRTAQIWVWGRKDYRMD